MHDNDATTSNVDATPTTQCQYSSPFIEMFSSSLPLVNFSFFFLSFFSAKNLTQTKRLNGVNWLANEIFVLMGFFLTYHDFRAFPSLSFTKACDICKSINGLNGSYLLSFDKNGQNGHDQNKNLLCWLVLAKIKKWNNVVKKVATWTSVGPSCNPRQKKSF